VVTGLVLAEPELELGEAEELAELVEPELVERGVDDADVVAVFALAWARTGS
jgi:hypothetical protein